jgi:hypothetical protein
MASAGSKIPKIFLMSIKLKRNSIPSMTLFNPMHLATSSPVNLSLLMIASSVFKISLKLEEITLTIAV